MSWADKQKGGLRLDARATVLAGGSTGPAVVPGNPKESLLVDAINYGETYQMPPKSKLPPEEIATLTEWVQRGAPWGVDDSRSARITRRGQDPRRALEGRIPGAGSILELPAAQQGRAARGDRPPTPAGCATRSTASSWPPSNETTWPRRPKPASAP